jgi:hypothetical protein
MSEVVAPLWWHPVHPISLPVPPNSPNIVKKRRLAEKTKEIVWNGTSGIHEHVTEAILTEQDRMFNAYENEMRRLNTQTAELLHKNIAAQTQIDSISRQLSAKINQVSKVTRDHAQFKAEISELKSELDVALMRIYEAETRLEEKTVYYKELVHGLQKSAANAEESSAYMRYLYKIMSDYRHGEPLDDSMSSTTKVCTVCMSAPANVCAKPCHHLEWCSECAIIAFGMSNDAFETKKTIDVHYACLQCPRCKTGVGIIDYLYT